jgi:hypothetical protein
MTTKEVKFATKETPGAVLISMGEFRRIGAKAAEGRTKPVLTVVHVNYCILMPNRQQESQQAYA